MDKTENLAHWGEIDRQWYNVNLDMHFACTYCCMEESWCGSEGFFPFPEEFATSMPVGEIFWRICAIRDVLFT